MSFETIPNTNPFNDATTIGAILLRSNKITREQLSKAIQRQIESSRLLGEELMSLGAVSKRDIEKALELQKVERSNKRVEKQFSLLENVMRDTEQANCALERVLNRSKADA